ncbi:hypothetical protein [Eikenella corrodens]|uniref:hypothetical protein n=1 Tax=Eikenella corrodens TaxID=539 RepID=UPI0019D21A0A|nr:hypothetical protein [Eikenella corrodens]
MIGILGCAGGRDSGCGHVYYFLNPSFGVTDAAGQEAYLLKKEPSLMERRFSLHKTGTAAHDELVTLSLMMLMLLERTKG